ncbi:MAG: hypothetical protein ABR518_04490, partial [Actinomycetota bacterium]
PSGPRREVGAVVTGLVVRVALILSIFGVAMYEGGEILRAQVRAQSAARAAAAVAARLFDQTHDQPRASARAVEAAREVDRNAHVKRIDYWPDGSVTVTVARTARTFVSRHVSFLKPFTVQRATERESLTT